MSDEQRFGLFSVLYLLSFAVFAGWFVLLLIGLVQSDLLAFANRIALPTLLGSIIGMELFRWLRRRAEKRLLPHVSNG